MTELLRRCYPHKKYEEVILLNPYQELDQAMRECRKCADLFAQNPVDPRAGVVAVVEPRPIVSGIRPKPLMMIGQAPGLTEYQTGKPFQGDAGKGIKSVLAELGLHQASFDNLVYSAAVIKCFPGSKALLRRDKVREDILPSAAMISNCQPFFEKQIQLADPKIIVTLGRLPLKAYLKLTGRTSSLARLEHFVGRKETWKGRAVVFFPHTSGQSRWLNELKNRVLFGQAKALLRSELLEQHIVTV